jgi:hypothetical protein
VAAVPTTKDENWHHAADILQSFSGERDLFFKLKNKYRLGNKFSMMVNYFVNFLLQNVKLLVQLNLSGIEICSSCSIHAN